MTDQSPCKETLESIIKNPSSKTPTKKEKQAAAILMKRIEARSKQGFIELPTGGKTITYVRVVKHQKPSCLASSPTKKKRSQKLNEIRKRVGGDSIEDVQAQFESDFKRQPLSVKSHVLAKSKIKVVVDSKLALAMKENMGLTWDQEKKRRRFWKTIGVYIPSEHKERKIYREIVKGQFRIDGIETQYESMAGPSKQVKSVAFVRNLKSFVFQLLDQHQANGMLSWHDGGIPEDQIWLKIGGDHGRGSLKICVQIANVDNPNSSENTRIVAMIETKDTPEVIKEVIENLLYDIDSLKSARWNGKHFTMFVFGDYAFLCAVYGLSGAKGKHPCLWCKCTQEDIQKTDQGLVQDRTLTDIRSKHKEFMEDGGKLANAKHFQNCIRPPLLNIEIERVVPMYLHILLGIVLKHHNWLEAETHHIDVMLAHHFSELESYTAMGFPDFDKYVDSLRKLASLKDRLIDLDLLVADAKTDREREKRSNDQFSTASEITQLESNIQPLQHGKGPITNSIQGRLDKHKIVPQAYHSRSFIGNHCHKYMKSEVHKDITSHISTYTNTLTQDRSINEAANKVKHTFDTLNGAFSDIHKQISHTQKIDPSEHESIQANINRYMSFYRQYFPDKVIPKMHILEHHCLPFTELFGFGLGLLGEQGGELIHHTLAKIERRMQGIKSSNKRLRSTIEAHHVTNSPELRKHIPQIKKRKIISKNN